MGKWAKQLDVVPVHDDRFHQAQLDAYNAFVLEQQQGEYASFHKFKSMRVSETGDDKKDFQPDATAAMKMYGETMTSALKRAHKADPAEKAAKKAAKKAVKKAAKEDAKKAAKEAAKEADDGDEFDL
jgi:hypothetical protein